MIRTSKASVGRDNPRLGKLLLAVGEVGHVLGFSPDTARIMDRAGQLPTPILTGPKGSTKRWRRDELRAWLAADCPGRERWVWTPTRLWTVERAIQIRLAEFAVLEGQIERARADLASLTRGIELRTRNE